MTTFALIVSTPPTDNKTSTALKFAQTLVTQGHSITGVFFYQDGVINANHLVQTPSDELNLMSAWQEFNKESGTPLYLCITAAERRGLTDSLDNDLNPNVAENFTISGLGELVVLTSQADKVVQL